MNSGLLNKANAVNKDLEVIKKISSGWSVDSQADIIEKYNAGEVKVRNNSLIF